MLQSRMRVRLTFYFKNVFQSLNLEGFFVKKKQKHFDIIEMFKSLLNMYLIIL